MNFITRLLALGVCFIGVSGCHYINSSNEFYGVSPQSDKVLFVLDISGSMEGKNEGSLTDQAVAQGVNHAANQTQKVVGGKVGQWIGKFMRSESTKLGAAKRQLFPAIRGLPATAKFNIVVFGSQISTWQRGLAQASEGNKNYAIGYLQAIKAKGSTPIRAGMQQALLSGANTIYLVTDGKPTDGNAAEIRKEIAARNRQVGAVIHTIGLGDDQDRGFLMDVAQDNNGRYITNDSWF